MASVTRCARSKPKSKPDGKILKIFTRHWMLWKKRLKKVELTQENDIKQSIHQLFDGQRATLEKFQSVNEINDRVKDIQGAVDVLKVLTVKKSNKNDG